MGSLRRHPLNGLDHAAAVAARASRPAPPDVQVLTNAAVAPGCRLLSLYGWLQRVGAQIEQAVAAAMR
jgi:hypothetical protein